MSLRRDRPVVALATAVFVWGTLVLPLVHNLHHHNDHQHGVWGGHSHGVDLGHGANGHVHRRGGRPDVLELVPLGRAQTRVGIGGLPGDRIVPDWLLTRAIDAADGDHDHGAWSPHRHGQRTASAAESAMARSPLDSPPLAPPVSTRHNHRSDSLAHFGVALLFARAPSLAEPSRVAELLPEPPLRTLRLSAIPWISPPVRAPPTT